MEKSTNSDGALNKSPSSSNSQTPTEYLSDIASRMSSTFFENLDQAGFKFWFVFHVRLFKQPYETDQIKYFAVKINFESNAKLCYKFPRLNLSKVISR